MVTVIYICKHNHYNVTNLTTNNNPFYFLEYRAAAVEATK
jgi:hypothetical protein